MKKLIAAITGLLLVIILLTGLKSIPQQAVCTYNKDSMIVVMRFERKVKPEYILLFKKSFNKYSIDVLSKEQGCLLL